MAIPKREAKHRRLAKQSRYIDSYSADDRETREAMREWSKLTKAEAKKARSKKARKAEAEAKKARNAKARKAEQAARAREREPGAKKKGEVPKTAKQIETERRLAAYYRTHPSARGWGKD